MFNKDILLIDEETSGLDPKKHEIIQLAAVLLDRKTLKEKKHFNSYIKPTRWRLRDPESDEVHKISWDKLKGAPSLKSVLQKFNRAFGREVILSYYVGTNDIAFLHSAYRAAKISYPFDYHNFNIWGVFFTYLAKRKLLKSRTDFGGFSLESMIELFRLETPPLHDALVDCRVEAEIFRRVIKDIKV